MSGSPQWSLSLRFANQNPVHTSLLPHTCHMPRPSHSVQTILHHRLWPVRLSHIFPHNLTNSMTFFLKLLNIKCVLIFCTTFVWNISHSKKNSARHYHKLYCGVHVKCSLFFSDFNETWDFSTDFRKYSNINLHKNPFSGSQVVLRRQTDGQTWWG